MQWQEVAGLAAAVCWASGSFIYSRLDASAAALNLGKNAVAGVLLCLSLPFFGSGMLVWQQAPWTDISLLVLSGVVGIQIGDSAYFRSIQILGPRKALVLTTLTPPFSAIFGWFLLAEALQLVHLLAMALTLAGISMVIRDRTLASDRSGLHEGRIRDGIWLGIFAAFCQSTGIAISKLVMISSLPPLEVSAARISVAMIGGGLVALLAGSLPEWKQQLLKKGVPGRIFVASFIGTYIGIWLSHVSAKAVGLAIATTQMSMTPVFMVLLVAIFLRKKISVPAMFGMLLAILGVALLMQQG